MQKMLRHLFIPHESNSHRPRVLHHHMLFLFIVAFILGGVFLPSLKQSHPDVLGISANISNDDLLSITNQDRAQNSLPPLVMNTELASAAQAKGQYMLTHNFWAHFAPDGTSPWFFIKQAGYEYIYAGENLARGFTTASDVVNAWMASPGHRANMLSPNYHDVGFSVQEGNLTGEDTILVVEMFGSASSQPVSKDTSTSVATETSGITPSSVPTIVLSPTPTNVAGTSGNITLRQAQPQEVAGIQQKPLINSTSLSKNIALSVVGMLLIALILDLVYIRRLQVTRFVAHNFDHILFLVMIILLILFIFGRGGIL